MTRAEPHDIPLDKYIGDDVAEEHIYEEIVQDGPGLGLMKTK